MTSEVVKYRNLYFYYRSQKGQLFSQNCVNVNISLFAMYLGKNTCVYNNLLSPRCGRLDSLQISIAHIELHLYHVLNESKVEHLDVALD